MEERSTIDENDEIDLLELVRAFWHRMWLILLAAIAGGGIAWAYSRLSFFEKYDYTLI